MPPAKPSILRKVAMNDFLECLRIPRLRWLRVAMTVLDVLPEVEVRSLDRFYSPICEAAKKLRHPVPDPGNTALACLHTLAFSFPRDQPFPRKPGDALDAMKLGGDAIYRSFRNSGWPRLAYLCQLFPREYCDAILSRENPPKIATESQSLVSVDLKLLRRLVAIAEVNLGAASALGRAECADVPRQDLEAIIGLNVANRDCPFGDRTSGLSAALDSVMRWSRAADDDLIRLLIAQKLPVFSSSICRMSEQLLREYAQGKAGAIACRSDALATSLMRKAWVEDPENMEFYTLAQGWVFDDAGSRRELCWRRGVRLICSRNAEQLPPAGTTPVSLYIEHDEECPCCGMRMVNFLDLDLQTAVLKALALRPDGRELGTEPVRLRFPMCPECIHDCSNALIYARVSLQGHATVRDPALKRPPRRDRVEATYEQAGAACAAFVGAPVDLDDMLDADDSVGGLPHWQQEPEWPKCCCCVRHMLFVGQAGLTPKRYAFLCADCMVATVTEQSD